VGSAFYEVDACLQLFVCYDVIYTVSTDSELVLQWTDISIVIWEVRWKKIVPLL